jgi:hypothetical protein
MTVWFFEADVSILLLMNTYELGVHQILWVPSNPVINFV